MKKIGILGGISLASTIQYYKTITDLYFQQAGDYYYPEIFIHSLDFQYFTDLEDQTRMEEYRHYILSSLHALKNAGADFGIMAANSPHSVLDDIRDQANLPILSIVDAVGREANRLGLKKLLLTGIRYTMQNNFYPRGLSRYGIETVTPTDPQQDEINRIIFEELSIHKYLSASKTWFIEAASAYPVDGIILGCTELPQMIQQSDMRVPVLDTLDLHCKATLAYALEE